MDIAGRPLPVSAGKPTRKTQKGSIERPRVSQKQTYTRILTACDSCRTSKTRCDAARPECGKCVKRGRTCIYSETDPSTIFEAWGTKILTAIENQGRVLENIAQSTRYSGVQEHTPRAARPSSDEDDGDDDDDLETLSRKDVSWTPITGSDKVLDWGVFPPEKPVSTLPVSAYRSKPNPFSHETINPSATRISELRDIFVADIEPVFPFVPIDKLDASIANIIESGFDWSVSTCLVLAVFSLAAIWGHYPEDERRLVAPEDTTAAYTVTIPEHRYKESSIYFAMAQRRMSTAMQDDSLIGVVCLCLFGSWYQYNFEPMQGWKMFRAGSELWAVYNLKHAHGGLQRSKQEESLEQLLYWTCMKAECEMRFEIPNLPPCTLQESRFPFSLPTFPANQTFSTGLSDCNKFDATAESTPSSHYYFLAEISLRRLLNRTRHAATQLSTNIDSPTATRIAETFYQLENQLEQWLECLPPALLFNVPLDSWPPPDEPELVKLMRERYLEVRELLFRAFLYICLHGGTRLTDDQSRIYGAKASAGLRLSVYRIQTEKPFFRHAGSWIGCRVRFNQALCLIAAVRGKQLGIAAAAYVVVPPTWRECVDMVQDRLGTWAEQGAGVPELAILLSWLVKLD